MLFLIVCLIGTLGYLYLSKGSASFIDCLYMTVITLTGVGYGEIVDLAHLPYGRVFTMVLIVFGMSVILYAISTVTAFIVEGTLRNVLWRRRMAKLIAKTENHYIVCGAGETSRHVLIELAATRRPFVVVEHDRERIERLCEEFANVPFVEGDAHDDEVLREAGIDCAAGLIAALPNDKDNLFVTVTAKQLNPDIRIVARGIQPQAREKLLRAGADSVVSPNMIGGMRMVSEMIRPAVVSFLDLMLRDKDKTMRIEEATIGPESELVGKTLEQARPEERTHTTVLAVRRAGEERFVYNPRPVLKLESGMTLVALGEVSAVRKLRKLAEGGAEPSEDDTESATE
jgi:voltage-gated potassium channel